MKQKKYGRDRSSPLWPWLKVWICWADSRSRLQVEGIRSAFGMQLLASTIFGTDPMTGNGQRDLQPSFQDSYIQNYSLAGVNPLRQAAVI